MKPNHLLLLLSGLLAFFSPLPAGAVSTALTAQEIVKRADDVRGPDGSFSFNVRVKDFQGGTLTRENIYKVYSKGPKATLVETVFPERLSGRKLLMAGALWLYLPTIKRPTRVGLQQRLTGEVANGDIARARFSGDYSAKLEGKENIRGKPYYRLSLTAQDKTLPYRNIRMWVGEKDFVTLKADFFALSGKKLKTGEYSEMENILGKPRLTKLLIKDAVQPSRQSQLKYYNYRRENLNDSMFNKESLAD